MKLMQRVRCLVKAFCASLFRTRRATKFELPFEALAGHFPTKQRSGRQRGSKHSAGIKWRNPVTGCTTHARIATGPGSLMREGHSRKRPKGFREERVVI